MRFSKVVSLSFLRVKEEANSSPCITFDCFLHFCFLVILATDLYVASLNKHKRYKIVRCVPLERSSFAMHNQHNYTKLLILVHIRWWTRLSPLDIAAWLVAFDHSLLEKKHCVIWFFLCSKTVFCCSGKISAILNTKLVSLYGFRKSRCSYGAILNVSSDPS